MTYRSRIVKRLRREYNWVEDQRLTEDKPRLVRGTRINVVASVKSYVK